MIPTRARAHTSEMARFARTKPCPEVRGGYTAFRPYVRYDFETRCAYCLVEEVNCGGPENYELDHFRPRSLFPEFEHDFYNIYYACHPCNLIKRAKWPSDELRKRGVYLVDLCASDFEEHFQQGDDGVWEGKTLAARYTIDILRLNRPHLVRLRHLVSVFRMHPR